MYLKNICGFFFSFFFHKQGDNINNVSYVHVLVFGKRFIYAIQMKMLFILSKKSNFKPILVILFMYKSYCNYV